MQVDEDKFPSLPGGPSVPNAQTPSPAKSVYQSVASSLWARSPEQHAAAPQHAQQDPAPQHTQHQLYETAPDTGQPGASDHAQQAPQDWTADADVQDMNGWDRTMPSAGRDAVNWAEQQDQEVEATWQVQGQSAGYEHQEALEEQADGAARDVTYQQQQGSWEQPHQPAADGQQGSWSQPQSDPWQQQGSWEQPQQPADNSSWPQQSGWPQTQKPVKKKQAQKPAQPQQSGWDQAQQSGWDQPQQSGYGADAAHSHPQEQQHAAYGYEQQQMPTFNDWDALQGYVNDRQQQQGQHGKGGWDQSPGGHPQWQGSLPKTAAWDSDPSPDRPSLHGQNSQRQVLTVDSSCVAVVRCCLRAHMLLHAFTICFDMCPEHQGVLQDDFVTMCMTAGAGKGLAC